MATRQRSQLNAVGGHSSMNVRRCPTLPQGRPCSTIGAASLSFRVRNVSGRFPRAMAAETLVPAPPERVGGVVVSVARVPVSGPGGVGCRGVRVCVVLYVCFRLLGTTEWTRAISGHARQPYNSVCVVIVKLSAY